MGVDLVVRNALGVSGRGSSLNDVAIDDGLIVAIGPDLEFDGEELDARGRLLVPGLVETHIHLDKAHLAGPDLADGGLAGAIAATSSSKAAFTPDDVQHRAVKTLRSCVAHGTTHVRTHIELDASVEMRGFDGVVAATREMADQVTVQLCVFAQEGLSDQPATRRLLIEGLERGAAVVGGAPYTDRDPRAQIDEIFELARRYDVDIDLHLDLADTTDSMQIAYVCDMTERTQWGGRVTVGHVTQLAMLGTEELGHIATRVADVGVAVTTLPSTDLFLMGRATPTATPRGVAPIEVLRAHGVTCSISTNNVMNSFTPYGDASLVRMANLYANVADVSGADRLTDCLSMITDQAAAIVGVARYGIDVGSTADLVLLDASTPAEAVATVAPAVWGVKSGRHTFTRSDVTFHDPGPRANHP